MLQRDKNDVKEIAIAVSRSSFQIFAWCQDIDKMTTEVLKTFDTLFKSMQEARDAACHHTCGGKQDCATNCQNENKVDADQDDADGESESAFVQGGKKKSSLSKSGTEKWLKANVNDFTKFSSTLCSEKKIKSKKLKLLLAIVVFILSFCFKYAGELFNAFVSAIKEVTEKHNKNAAVDQAKAAGSSSFVQADDDDEDDDEDEEDDAESYFQIVMFV